jgi:hypothetical protein
MHSAAAAGASNGAACALGSGDSATAKLLTLMGSAGLLIRPVDTGEPLVVARMFASSSIFPSDFSPLPTIPPPRA